MIHWLQAEVNALDQQNIHWTEVMSFYNSPSPRPSHGMVQVGQTCVPDRCTISKIFNLRLEFPCLPPESGHKTSYIWLPPLPPKDCGKVVWPILKDSIEHQPIKLKFSSTACDLTVRGCWINWRHLVVVPTVFWAMNLSINPIEWCTSQFDACPSLLTDVLCHFPVVCVYITNRLFFSCTYTF